MRINRNRPIRPSSSFGALFRIAYRRIWKSRALRGWETFFWMIAAANLGLALFGYASPRIEVLLATLYWLLLIFLPLILIAAWIYRAHVSLGFADDSLKIVPQRAAMTLLPRMLAVGATWLQFFAPLLVIFFTLAGNLLVPMFQIGSEDSDTAEILALAGLQMLGWIAVPIAWGFLMGSRLFRRGGPFMVGYCLPAMVMVFLAYARVLGDPNYETDQLLELLDPEDALWPKLVQVVGLAGIPTSIVIFYLGCAEWGRRSR